MPEKSNDPKQYFKMRRVSQITDSHCGPAVLEMLLSNVGIDATQEEIARAAGVQDLIQMHGTRIDQLALAVKRLAPEMQFWYKEHSTIEELEALVMEYRYPVGVEWQGVFEDEGEPDPEPDYGHYSIVALIDREKQALLIVDPYRNYILEDRVFALDEFSQRWWDTNMAPDPVTGSERLIKDDHMMFIITLPNAAFPLNLNMQRG